jgi:hypothetical protein
MLIHSAERKVRIRSPPAASPLRTQLPRARMILNPFGLQGHGAARSPASVMSDSGDPVGAETGGGRPTTSLNAARHGIAPRSGSGGRSRTDLVGGRRIRFGGIEPQLRLRPPSRYNPKSNLIVCLCPTVKPLAKSTPFLQACKTCC